MSFQSHLPLSIVSEMITPGILILATGSLINSTIQRLSRTVDRARVLLADVKNLRESGQIEHAAMTICWLASYSDRVTLLERALLIEHASIFLFVASTLVIALNEITSGRFIWLAPAVVIIGTCLLFAGTLALAIETKIAAGQLRNEITDASVTLADAERKHRHSH